MPRIALASMALVLLAGLGDAVGAHGLAFYLLLVAVPVTAVAALAALDRALDPAGEPKPLRHAWLQGVVLVLVLTTTAARAPVRGEPGIPRLAVSALLACLVVVAVQAFLACLPALRRALGRPRLSRTRLAER